jgi:type VI secretion system protein ImpK
MDLMAYVVYFQRTVARQQPPFEQVKADVARLLAKSEEVVRKGVATREDYDEARFAVCAWVDEAILSSNWTYRGSWQREQLQRVHFNTTDAGEELFERLNRIGLQQREVREVYYLVLALGFMGRYSGKGDEYLLDQLKGSNLKILLGGNTGAAALERTELFPEGYPPEAVAAAPAKSSGLPLAALIGAGAPVLLFAVLWIIYRFTLSGVGENFLKAVP